MSETPIVKPVSNVNTPNAAPIERPILGDRTKATVAGPPARKANVFGDVIPVAELRGITPEYAGKLKSIGILDTRQLYEGDASHIAEKLSVPRSTVEKFQQMSELLAVNAIEPKDAELLVDSNVTTIAALRATDAAQLLPRVTKAEASITPPANSVPTVTADVAAWIQAAREHVPAATVSVLPASPGTLARQA